MKVHELSIDRVRTLLHGMRGKRIHVIGDVILDHLVWGRVSRISPEAPVPVVEFLREEFMPGGAANVARNVAALKGSASLYGVTGTDAGRRQLLGLLAANGVNRAGLLPLSGRLTTVKTRVIAHHQQIVRLDRETRVDLDDRTSELLLRKLEPSLRPPDAIVMEDYGKGVVTQHLVRRLVHVCRARGIWLSADPKPVHELDLSGLSLITPNRKEAFELAGMPDTRPSVNPLADEHLLTVVRRIFERYKPDHLLVTLGDQGMLLCHAAEKPLHIPTFAKEVFDVSGAGDTVIAAFTLAISAGATPLEAAILSNHAAGVVVGKIGTATVSPVEVLASFHRA